MVSTEKLLALREWYGNPNLACLPIAGAAAAAVMAALDELLAFREGYDPAERLPDGGKVVLIHYEYPHSDLLETATYDPVLERWNVILFTGTAVAETDEIDRWYPAPGGA
jgi:hypothetical protein